MSCASVRRRCGESVSWRMGIVRDAVKSVDFYLTKEQCVRAWKGGVKNGDKRKGA